MVVMMVFLSLVKFVVPFFARGFGPRGHVFFVGFGSAMIPVLPSFFLSVEVYGCHTRILGSPIRIGKHVFFHTLLQQGHAVGQCRSGCRRLASLHEASNRRPSPRKRCVATFRHWQRQGYFARARIVLRMGFPQQRSREGIYSDRKGRSIRFGISVRKIRSTDHNHSVLGEGLSTRIRIQKDNVDFFPKSVPHVFYIFCGKNVVSPHFPQLEWFPFLVGLAIFYIGQAVQYYHAIRPQSNHRRHASSGSKHVYVFLFFFLVHDLAKNIARRVGKAPFGVRTITGLSTRTGSFAFGGSIVPVVSAKIMPSCVVDLLITRNFVLFLFLGGITVRRVSVFPDQ
mmetsp:Transcript_21348/g.44980  ORF Transcript_21348/g.44980 Transcript_21348/m.44980 type:complete len:340 (+) Transcript_21348:1419-2438(+)